MTTAESIIFEAVRCRVLLVATEAGVLAKPYLGNVPPELIERLECYRDEVLASLRGEPSVPAGAPLAHAHELPAELLPAEAGEGEPNPFRWTRFDDDRQRVLDTLAEVWDDDPARARDLAHDWCERLAIAHDGQGDREEAHRIALAELQAAARQRGGAY